MKKLLALGIVGLLFTALWATTLPGAWTRTSLPDRMRIERVGSTTGAIAETFTPVAPYYLHYVMVHYTAAVSTNDLTISVDSATSATGTNFDYLLSTTDLSSTTDVIWQPDSPYLFLVGDAIDIAADDQSTTWGLTICWEETN